MSRRRLAHAAKGSPEAYAWAERMMKLREQRAKAIRSLGKKREKEFFGAERNPKRHRKNPIAIFGNPRNGINAKIEGVMYNEVIELRARKTSYKRGYYKHPFESNVRLLALDNGDLLIHSRDGHKLWERD